MTEPKCCSPTNSNQINQEKASRLAISSMCYFSDIFIGIESSYLLTDGAADVKLDKTKTKFGPSH